MCMKTLFATVLLALSMNVHAALVGLTDVGMEDTFIMEGAKLGSTAAETVWVNGLLSPTVDWTVKLSTVDYFATDDPDLYAFELGLEPDYFLLKNSTRVALFENVASLDWGVFDMTLLSDAFHFGDDLTISHVTSFDDTGGGGSIRTIPEPGHLLLISLGLVGLGLSRRLSA